MNVIRGDQATIDYSLYGWDDSNASYFEENLKKLSGVMRDKKSAIFDNIKNVYNRYHDSDIIRRAKRTIRNMGGAVRDETVITRYYDPRQANRRMREFVMANRRVRDLCNRGIFDGYSDTDYVHDEIRAEANHALAVDGMYQDDGTCERWWLVDGIDIEEERLDMEDQIEIQLTWDSTARFINEDMDPTDRV